MDVRSYRRWLVLGASGGGKTRLSLELGEILGLPVVHLDRHYWRPGWVEPPKEEWRRAVIDLVAREEWVIDGNYSGTVTERLARAEAVLLLDPPVWTSLRGIYDRSLFRRGRVRPDLADGCEERLPDRTFLWFVLSYKWRSRPKVLQRIAAAPHVWFRHLRSRREAAAFLSELRRSVS